MECVDDIITIYTSGDKPQYTIKLQLENAEVIHNGMGMQRFEDRLWNHLASFNDDVKIKCTLVNADGKDNLSICVKIYDSGNGKEPVKYFPISEKLQRNIKKAIKEFIREYKRRRI